MHHSCRAVTLMSSCLAILESRDKNWMRTTEYSRIFFNSIKTAEWCDGLPEAAVYLPYGFAWLCCQSLIPTFCLPNGWPRPGSLDCDLTAFPSVLCPTMPVPTEATLTAGSYQHLADDLRIVAQSLAAGDGTHQALELLRKWASVAQQTEDQLLPLQPRAGRPTSYIQQVLLADALRNDAMLQPVLAMCAQVLLPTTMAEDVIQRLQDKKILSKAELSRSRFIIDATYMILWRDLHRGAMRASRGCTWYMMTDSSPQFGRDYQVLLVRRIDTASLAELYDIAAELCKLWSTESAAQQTRSLRSNCDRTSPTDPTRIRSYASEWPSSF